MTIVCPVIIKNDKDEFRVVMMGQPDGHLVNWWGCNYHYAALPKDLRKKFTSFAEAKEYEKVIEKKMDSDQEFQNYFKNRNGSFLQDSMIASKLDYE